MRDWVSFSEVKKRVKLDRVLRSYGVDWLRPSGEQQYRGRCPIHQGQGTEAFHAHLGRNVFHCFACGAGGNVLDFVVAMEGCSMRDAALRVQESQDGAGVAWASEPERSKLVTKERGINPPLGFSLDLDPAHPYLAGRGMDAATASYFGVGYYSGRGLMSGRIAIPIHDEESISSLWWPRRGRGDPRYRFPAGFQKSQVLFNYHRARAASDDRVVVVEGFFDCMRVHQAGFSCVVALMGARLSRAQKDLMANRFSSIVLLLDGDQAGRRATAQIASDLAPACSVTLLPPDTQPDQMAADQIRQVLTKAERRTAIRAN